jgi:hypothetical protein
VRKNFPDFLDKKNFSVTSKVLGNMRVVIKNVFDIRTLLCGTKDKLIKLTKG